MPDYPWPNAWYPAEWFDGGYDLWLDDEAGVWTLTLCPSTDAVTGSCRVGRLPGSQAYGLRCAAFVWKAKQAELARLVSVDDPPF